MSSTRRYRKRWRNPVLVFFSGLFVVVLFSYIQPTRDRKPMMDNSAIMRKLLHQKEDNGSSAQFPNDLFTKDERKHGAIILHVLGLAYMFVALAVVCDEFFIPALDVITESLAISEDVAGATFMAAGGSAPELFTSIIGVFISYDDVGIGTIVGSAVFNLLFVISMCAIFSKTVLQLTWWPLFRDVSFYSIILIILMVCFKDNVIHWYEATILLSCYIVYVTFMKFNSRLEMMVKKLLNRNRVTRVGSTDQLMPSHSDNHSPMSLTTHSAQRDARNGRELRETTIGNGFHGSATAGGNVSTILPERNAPSQSTTTSTAQGKWENKPGSSKQLPMDCWEPQDPDEPDEPLDLSWPDTCHKRINYILVAPIVFPLWITLPDVRRPEKRKWFPWGFLGSIMWIAIFSYLMVWWATLVGETINIPNEVMGLTFLAAGTSIPDLITSVLVARKGFGDMAVSSSVGSNIFDIAVGLPLPWLLACLISGSVHVSSVGMACSIFLLFMMLIFVIVSIALFKWKMNVGLAVVMFLLYFVFIAVSLMLEYGVISCTNIMSTFSSGN
ncbi:sodium/potassium/calcium exchanger Nckx30C-like isoform X3 [Centruroides sculpturatus]|uniref:sodium/potassium/calcium exchanger Nckx30C-like isoform X3 n=1 Tax=Centruroides sculpturatus TaxID=218467 RepID=UPI000C6CFE64|nr:sodium/potassium/calcium exchanger Nckx30C-like isoform X3 [Centruroides sculpturatus]